MARYKDIFDMIEYATDERCSNRLLAFAKVRHTVRSGPLAAQSAPRQLVNRFCSVAPENQSKGLWCLDLLQMCSLHAGDAFVLALNSQDRLNDLLNVFLNPVKSRLISLQIHLKIMSLFQTWSTDYKNFSANNFERAYERLVRGPAMPNVDTLQNSHWLPDRDVFGNSIEENRYNLQDFVSELTTEHKQQHAELAMIFQMVSGLQNSGQDSSSRDEKKFSDACKRTLEIRREVDASKAFWNDVSRNLTDRPQNLEEMASTVQTVFESMDQSIRCCLDVLNINPKAKEQPESSRKDDVKPDTGFEYGGRSVEPKIQTSTHASSKLNKGTENVAPLSSVGIWNCGLCKLQFGDKIGLLNHTKEADHLRQLEIRLRKTPKKQSSTSKPDLEPYSEPYTPLQLPNPSTTLPKAQVTATTTCETAAPNFRQPTSAASKDHSLNQFSSRGPVNSSSVRRLRSDFEGRNQLPVGNQLTMALRPWSSLLTFQSEKALTEDRRLAKQTQTEASALRTPAIHRLQSRPINVQCNDCHLMFTNLEKLLSHKCHKVANSAPHRTHVPLPIPTSRDSDVSLYSFFCEACNLGFEERSLFKAHLLTPRHLFSSRRLEKINQSAPTASGHLANGSAEGLSAVSRDPISHTPQTRCKNNSESETVDPLIFEDSQIEWVPLEGDVDVSQNDFDDMFNENAKQMTAEEAKLYEMLPLGIERKVVQKPPSNPDYHLNLLPGGTEHVSTSQQSLMHVKAVETRRPWRTVESRTAESSDPPHDSTEHATVQQPEHTNKTRTLEAARGNSTSSEPAAGRKKLQGRGSKSQPSRSDTFYCNFCSVFLESVEIAKHVTSPSHQNNLKNAQRTATISKPLETIDNAIYAAAPPLASDSVIQDGEYIAVYVPTLHKPDENGRRVIFTQHVSLRPRQCHVCGAVFDDDEVLRRHLSFHGRNL
uniref:VHS domain-containing protein n=1 Tax=Mesocestoides corti TaxID=53468 RepID=A0A5K3EP64_MESCO